MMEVEIYNKENINELKWPNHKQSDYIKKYFTPMIIYGTKKYIKNIDSEVIIIKYGEIVIPATINEEEYENSYVCSPYTQYISYAKEELYLIKNKIIKYGLNFIIKSFSGIFKLCKINKVIIINNWFLSTNLYSKDLDYIVIEKLTKKIKKFYPNHTIIFRSINNNLLSQLTKDLRKLNFQLIGSRQIYIFNPNTKISKNSYKKIKKEEKMLSENSNVIIKRCTINDTQNIQKAYNNLYIEKYSRLNPQFSSRFILNSINDNLFNFFKLVDNNNSFLGVLGYFERENVITTPILGYINNYDTNTIYRILTIKLTSISKENQQVLNRSSGASKFKMSRGSFPEIEYNAIYYDHLNFYRKIPWIILKTIVNHIGIPVMKKYKL